MLLRVTNLSTYFFLDDGVLRAVDDFTFFIDEGETVAIVGESGCGKTILALSLINLIQYPGRIIEGKIEFQGINLLNGSDNEFRKVRGKNIGMIFQEPGAALNPLYSVGLQLVEVLITHKRMTRQEAKIRAIELISDVGIREPEKCFNAYPHQLSGGMKQRILIAIAMSTNPKLLIADEPTTALDMTVQLEILELLMYLQQQYHMAILIITHDLSVVSALADRVLVMYTGKLMEEGATADLFTHPLHPYTKGLLNSVSKLGSGSLPIKSIPGSVPDLLKLPSGCTFHPRCDISDESCTHKFPDTVQLPNNRRCSCLKIMQ